MDPRKNNDAKRVDPAAWCEPLPPRFSFEAFRHSKGEAWSGRIVTYLHGSFYSSRVSKWLHLNRIRDVDVERDYWRLDTLDDRLITSFERNARDELIRR